MENILEWCGFKTAYDLLKANMSEKELMSLLEDLVNAPDEASEFVEEEITRIAEDTYEWIDHEKLMDDADHRKYSRYRDGDYNER
tara:strand:+ start:1022 stop:1276 length:255 start_codon:yes stop_codon:yes gene_type:complete